MHSTRRRLGILVAALALATAACQDTSTPTDLTPDGPDAVTAAQGRPGQLPDVVPEIMALPQTVFGGVDPATGSYVFGVENEAASRGVATALAARGVSSDAYRIRITEPIHFASSLRDEHRPTTSGLQINFGMYVCTLGFSVDFAGDRSFITNSHCTDQQGTTSGTVYYQPLAGGAAIAVEADDPGYSKGGPCSRGKQCRFSDASRAQYAAGVESHAEIPRTVGGVNSGSLEIDTGNSFRISEENDQSVTFSGTVHKVGRTTGWTSGTVTAPCVTVNVSGSNIQLLCQTIVENASATIVQGGDSGSPVFQPTGVNTAELIGILWGGNSSGSLFVFSPLSAIEDELGSMVATTDGTATGGGSGPGDGGDGGGGGSDCPPNSNSPRCR